MFMKETADQLFGDDHRWPALAAGRSQIPFATQASDDGRERARGNADQVSKMRRILEQLGNEIATPVEAREMLALKGGDTVGF